MKKKLSEQRSNMSKAGVISLIVFVAVLTAMAVTFCVLYAINKNGYETSSIALENVYQRSFYDLVENVNNTESKLGKAINSSDDEYTKKLLTEIYENSSDAQNNLSYLPISMNGIPETTSFINQLSGYTGSIAKSNNTISQADRDTLLKLYSSVSDVKYKLNEMSRELSAGYSITEHSADTKNDYTEFTTKFQGVKTVDQDYPTMIYDGPFSDSVVNKEIKGLNFEEISKEDATEKANKLFIDTSKVQYLGETTGKFQTYNFNIYTKNGLSRYAQFTKNGGKLLTISCYTDKDSSSITKEQAIKIAEDFALKENLTDMQCVWSDVVQNDAYINLAPVIKNVIYYPDLIKVKIDLSTGEIIGWEACPYYINHHDRQLEKATYAESVARTKIPTDFKIESINLALSPLDYNREVLTYEFKCTKNSDTYYIYINAKNGAQENILKVVETDNGNLLM